MCISQIEVANIVSTFYFCFQAATLIIKALADILSPF